MRLRVSILIVVVFAASCAKNDYRVERLDDGKATTIPMKFDSVSGVRSGDMVRAEVKFVDGTDSILINLTVHLAPSAECVSGDYRAMIGGHTSEGPVTCESLAFQGGQDQPSIGGAFVLKDIGRMARYRVSMPSTQMQRRFNP